MSKNEPSNLKILALEFSSAQRSVAALAAGRVCGRVTATTASGGTALALVERTLLEAGWEREEVEAIAVGLGPGSYTGIRVAIAVAQGWQLAQPVRLLGVGAVDCLAAQLQADGWHGRVTLAIEAQREEFYVATCALAPTTAQILEPLHLMSLEALQTRHEQGDTLAGPELDRWITGARGRFPEAAVVGRLAVDWRNAANGEDLEPIYLREPRFVKAPPPRVRPGAEAPRRAPGADPKPSDIP